jgi:hypothetical protein
MDGNDARDMEVKLGVECDRSPQLHTYIRTSLTQEYSSLTIMPLNVATLLARNSTSL